MIESGAFRRRAAQADMSLLVRVSGTGSTNHRELSVAGSV